MTIKNLNLQDLVVVSKESDVVYRVVEIEDDAVRIIDATARNDSEFKQSGWWTSKYNLLKPNKKQLSVPLDRRE